MSMFFPGHPQTGTQFFYRILYLFKCSSRRNGYIDSVFPRTKSQTPRTGIHFNKKASKFIIFQYIFQNDKTSQ